MSHNHTGRDAWLDDERALEEYYHGPICEGCGLRGDDCECDAQEEEPPEEEPKLEKMNFPMSLGGKVVDMLPEEPPVTEFRMRPSDACWSGDLSQQDWLDMNK